MHLQKELTACLTKPAAYEDGRKQPGLPGIGLSRPVNDTLTDQRFIVPPSLLTSHVYHSLATSIEEHPTVCFLSLYHAHLSSRRATELELPI